MVASYVIVVDEEVTCTFASDNMRETVKIVPFEGVEGKFGGGKIMGRGLVA